MDTAQSRTLYFADLDPAWDETFLYSLFMSMGVLGVVQAKVIRDRTTSLPMGYGFLDFDTHENAKAVLELYNGKEVPGFVGKQFRINWGERKGPGGVTGEHLSVFVRDLSIKVTDQMLYDEFKRRFPSCISARVISDHNTSASLGYGFVRFTDETELQAAVETMSKVVIGGQAIRVERAQDRKALSQNTQSFPHTQQMFQTPYPYPYPQAQAPQAAQQQPVDESNCTIFVGNLDPMVTETMLTKAFSLYGQVTQARIPTGKLIGFITMASHDQAASAIAGMNGMQLSTRPLRCAWGRKTPSSQQFDLPSPSPSPFYPHYHPFAVASQWSMWNMQGYGGGMHEYAPQQPQVNNNNNQQQQQQQQQQPPHSPPPLIDFSKGFDAEQANKKYFENRMIPHRSLHSPPMYCPVLATPFSPQTAK